jgi:hypothetical protein
MHYALYARRQRRNSQGSAPHSATHSATQSAGGQGGTQISTNRPERAGSLTALQATLQAAAPAPAMQHPPLSLTTAATLTTPCTTKAAAVTDDKAATPATPTTAASPKATPLIAAAPDAMYTTPAVMRVERELAQSEPPARVLRL